MRVARSDVGHRRRLDDQVEVCLESVGDHHDGPYYVVYFSGSFMVIRGETAILRQVRHSLLPKGGAIYFSHKIRTPQSLRDWAD